MLECPLYHDLRLEHIKRYYWRSPNVPKFIELFKSENTKHVRTSAMFVYKAMVKRDNVLYNS